ncbi:Uncharacterised protein [uncultured archaeon]|nr:Uncharacterised protein [uncultured archaeon]
MMELSWLGILAIIILVLIIIGLIVFCIIFWIWMLVDSIKRRYKDSNDKIVWVIVIVLTGILGAIIYYFVEKRKDRKRR